MLVRSPRAVTVRPFPFGAFDDEVPGETGAAERLNTNVRGDGQVASTIWITAVCQVLVGAGLGWFDVPGHAWRIAWGLALIGLWRVGLAGAAVVTCGVPLAVSVLWRAVGVTVLGWGIGHVGWAALEAWGAVECVRWWRGEARPSRQ